MTDFRALCAELVDALEEWRRGSGVSVDKPLLDRARAVLAQPEPPAEGEVAELAAWLRKHYEYALELGRPDWAHQSTRAADLLERQALQPVPVSERLPEVQDCTSQGWCWVLYRRFSTWTLEPPLGQNGQPTGWSHWLPAHALPLPTRTSENV